MESESKVFQDSIAEAFTSGVSDPILINVSTLFSYYRIERDGKYYFFKTYTENSRQTQHLLRREYELSSACDHPHIAKTFLFGEFIV